MTTAFFECDPTDPTSPPFLMESARLLQFYPLLVNTPIKFLFKEKASKRNGNPVMGKVTKVSPLYATLIDEVFIITIAYDEWSTLAEDRKLAWLDHFLAQCFCEEDEETGDVKYKVASPPLGGFSHVVERRGMEWHPDLVKLRTIPSVQEACQAQAAFTQTREERAETV